MSQVISRRILFQLRCWVWCPSYGIRPRFFAKNIGLYICLEDIRPDYDGEEVIVQECQIIYTTYILVGDSSNSRYIISQRYFGIREGCYQGCHLCRDEPYDCIGHDVAKSSLERATRRCFRKVDGRSWYPEAPRQNSHSKSNS